MKKIEYTHKKASVSTSGLSSISRVPVSDFLKNWLSVDLVCNLGAIDGLLDLEQRIEYGAIKKSRTQSLVAAAITVASNTITVAAVSFAAVSVAIDYALEEVDSESSDDE